MEQNRGFILLETAKGDNYRFIDLVTTACVAVPCKLVDGSHRMRNGRKERVIRGCNTEVSVQRRDTELERTEARRTPVYHRRVANTTNRVTVEVLIECEQIGER